MKERLISKEFDIMTRIVSSRKNSLWFACSFLIPCFLLENWSQGAGGALQEFFSEQKQNFFSKGLVEYFKIGPKSLKIAICFHNILMVAYKIVSISEKMPKPGIIIPYPDRASWIYHKRN